MKELKKLLLVLVSCSGIMGFSHLWREIQQPVEVIEVKEPKIEYISLSDFKKVEKIDQTDIFLDAIAQSESSNRYKIVNRWGYMGKYQFHRRTLKSLGYNVSRKEFLNSPYLQEKAMLDLLRANKESLGSRIKRWEGKKIDGVTITESGILAAAHLGGVGNVIKYLDGGIEFKDGNGTKLQRYLTKFSGYNLEL